MSKSEVLGKPMYMLYTFIFVSVNFNFYLEHYDFDIIRNFAGKNYQDAYGNLTSLVH